MYGAFPLTSDRFLAKSQSGDGEFSREVQSLPNLRREGSSVVSTRVREKNHTVSVGVLSDEYRDSSTLLEELGSALEVQNRFLHIVRDWRSIAVTGEDQSWLFEDDCIGVEYDPTYSLFSGSMKMLTDVSASVQNRSTLTNESGEGVDLSEYSGTGDFEFGVYLPIPDEVAYIDIKIGSDSSNYLLGTLISQYDDEPLSRGWNWFSIAWDLMQETGSVDSNLIGRYVSISIYYTTAQEEEEGFRISEVIWVNASRVRNYRCFNTGVPRSNRLASIDEVEISFICPSGLGEETTPSIFYISNGISDIAKEVEFTTGGSYSPDPKIIISLQSVTSLDKIEITNLLTNDTVSLDETWVANDEVVIDSSKSKVTVNNNQIGYSDVLPTFQVGYNKLLISTISSSEETASQTTQNVSLLGEL